MKLTDKERRIVRNLIVNDSESFVILARVAELNPATDFREADLRGINFGTDDLSGYDFRGSDLRGANLSHALRLKYTILNGIIADETTQWPPGWNLHHFQTRHPLSTKVASTGSTWSIWESVASVWAGATTIASPALRLLLRYRASRGKEIAARLPERRGIDASSRPKGRLIWLHAGSLGETVSIMPVLTSVAVRAPDVAILLTTGTVTSAGFVAQRLPEMGLADRVTHRFAPLDVPTWVARFLDHWRPNVAAFVESELWPNILSACQRRAIPMMLVNARMSGRSYGAWSRVPWMAKSTLGSFARVFARGDEDAARLRTLGAERVENLGDLTLSMPALPADPAVLEEMKVRLAGRPVFLAASTHPGEEALIKTVHESLSSKHPNLITIIVPRHPERGGELARTLNAQRRDAGPPLLGGLWIADSLGELGMWYRLSDAVFVGRSLLPPGGGQNLQQPALLGCAIATGPYTDNFTAHVALLQDARGLTITQDTSALIQFVGTMLADPTARQSMGNRAKTAVTAHETIVDDVAEALLGLIPPYE